MNWGMVLLSLLTSEARAQINEINRSPFFDCNVLHCGTPVMFEVCLYYRDTFLFICSAHLLDM